MELFTKYGARMFKIAARPVAAMFAAIMLTTGCISPKVTRRYKEAIFPPVATTPTTEVSLSLFALDVPTASVQTTILNLGERAQASLIKEISSKSKDTPSLVAALASPISKPKPEQRVIDRTVVDRR